MALKEIIDDFYNEPEPRLDEMIRWFKNNDTAITVSVIQRQFSVGWRTAHRALKQIKDRL